MQIFSIFFIFAICFRSVFSLTLEYKINCDALEYFDTSSLECSKCPDKQVPDSTGFKCECASSFTKVIAFSPSSITCQPCPGVVSENNTYSNPNSYTSSRDRSTCMLCDSNSGATYDDKSRDCTCPAGNFLVESVSVSDVNSPFQRGSFLSSKICVPCPNSFFVSPKDVYSCTKCDDPNSSQFGNTCTCNSGYSLLTDVCAPQSIASTIATSFSESTTVVYTDIESDQKDELQNVEVISATFLKYYGKSSYLCQEFGDKQACNTIANLCVLQHYNEDSAACSMYKRIAEKYKSNTNSESAWYAFPQKKLITRPANMPWLYYGDNPESILTAKEIDFKVSFDENSENDTAVLKFYLATYQMDGKFLGLIPLGNQLQVCSETQKNTDFLKFGTKYENKCIFQLKKFISDLGDTLFYDMYVLDENFLRAVPVINLNYRSNNVLVNVNKKTSENINDQYTRRFFVFDNLSGIQSTSNITTPKIIRFASSIELTIQVRDDSSVNIYPPTLTIQYSDRYCDAVIADEGDISKTSIGYASVSFKTVYRRETTIFERVFISFASIGAIFATFIGIARRPYVLLPEDDVLRSLWTLLIIGFIGKFFRVVEILYTQCTVDIALIDWEQSYGKLGGKGSEGSTTTMPVGVWRTLFVANEWNEIQSQRITSTSLTLLSLLFFLRAIDLEYLATPQPATSNLDSGSTSWILRYAVSVFFWLAISTFQIAFKYGIYFRFFKDPITQFIDLISVCNISLIVFKERCYGYYLHGRSVFTHADTDMIGLLANLKQEEERMTGSRGLLPNSDLQTFELIATQSLREEYDKIYLLILFQDLSDRTVQVNRVATKQLKKVPNEKALKAYGAMNHFFKGFIGLSHNFKYKIQDKTLFHKVTGISPTGIPSESSMFPDTGSRSFATCLFYGVEYDLLLFNIFFYCIVDLIFSNTFVSLITTWIIDQILKQIRSFFGESNISKKALVDTRFLL